MKYGEGFNKLIKETRKLFNSTQSLEELNKRQEENNRLLNAFTEFDDVSREQIEALETIRKETNKIAAERRKVILGLN